MPNLPHLSLKRVEHEAPRRKKPGYGRIPSKDFQQHGSKIQTQVSNTLHPSTSLAGINPALIVRLKINNPIEEVILNRFGLQLVGKSDDHTLVLFSSDQQMVEFNNRLESYLRGPDTGKKNAPYHGVFNNIEELGKLRPEDRIGRLLKEEGITSLDHFIDNSLYVLDLELWHTGNSNDCTTRLAEIRTFIEANSGRVTDTYVGSSLVLARIKLTGAIIKQLLHLDAVCLVESPPKVFFRMGEMLRTTLSDLADTPEPPQTAQGICTLDSGINSGHPLLGPAIGEATAVPAHLGDAADVNGHGTMVAGLALYGNLQSSIDSGGFIPELRLFSARVLNANNEFDDESLITTQMRSAIEYFKSTYGCRIFNASLGDPRMPFNGGKLSPWASILDHLSRELDIIIVVSAGNYEHEPPEDNADHHVTGYPRYLLEAPAKIIEPATGCIVLTVGAITSPVVTCPVSPDDVDLRPIAQGSQPSPFTRSGPGIGGSIKPELIEEGGNLIYHGSLRRSRNFPETDVFSTSLNYVENLFQTSRGTSFAAPIIANKAARILNAFPEATANLVRALIVSAAEVPAECRTLLSPIGSSAIRELCGYGVPSVEKAVNSDSNRVLLYSENELPFDCFHVYEIPIPSEIYQVQGKSEIDVTLAFDPPVRHSRLDYLGTTMSFRLIRGKNLDEVTAAFRQKTGDGDMDRIKGPFDCKMSPLPTEREGSTVQRATFTMKRNPTNYGDTYYLVVRCQREWAKDESFPQRYAAVVTIKHEAQVDLYAKIQARQQSTVRVQLRTRR